MYRKCFECVEAEDEWAKDDAENPDPRTGWGCGSPACHPEAGDDEYFVPFTDKEEQIRRIIEWRFKLGVRLS